MALAVLVLAAGGWFLLLSPHTSTVTLTADSSTAAPGRPVPITGRVSPPAPNRVVEISTGIARNGPFTPAGTAVTDASGHFSMQWSPTQPGTLWVRATATALGRDQQALSAPLSVTVRTPATLTLTAAATAIRTTGDTSVTATLTPAGGLVNFEKSPDGKTWTPMPGGINPSPGVTTVKVAGMAGGLWHIRSSATQTATATSATGKEVTILIEDYQAAGARYLQIVAPANDAGFRLNDLVNTGAPLSAVTAQAGTLSKAVSQEATDLRAYNGWPRETTSLITDLAKQAVLQADHNYRQSQTRTIDEWNGVANEILPSDAAGSADAVTIRDLLGLPKRDFHP